MTGKKLTNWKRAVFAGVVFMLVGLESAFAQPPTTWKDLQGNWVSNSTAFGTNAKSTLSVTPIFNDHFFQLQYRINAVHEGKATLIFEGVAYYTETEDGKYKAFWADSSGDLHPIVTSQDGTSLIAHWGTEGVKQGTTQYELRPDASLLVTDKILRDEKWVQFNQMNFVRVTESD